MVVPTARVDWGVGKAIGTDAFRGERRRHLTAFPTPLLLKAALRITTRLTGKWDIARTLGRLIPIDHFSDPGRNIGVKLHPISRPPAFSECK